MSPGFEQNQCTMALHPALKHRKNVETTTASILDYYTDNLREEIIFKTEIDSIKYYSLII